MVETALTWLLWFIVADVAIGIAITLVVIGLIVWAALSGKPKPKFRKSK